MSADRRIVYAAFLPFLLLALPILPSGSPSGGGGGGQTLAPPAAKYVVRFMEYRAAEDHREYLEAGLRGAAPPAGSWRWVERRNPAVAFPTDFAVLEIRDVHHAAVVAAANGIEDHFSDLICFGCNLFKILKNIGIRLKVFHV